MFEKPAYTLNELLTFHPAGRSKLYQDISAGRLKARKIGDKTIILHSEYLEYLETPPLYQAKPDEEMAH